MDLEIVTAAATEPLIVSDVRDDRRVDANVEDEVLSDKIAEARAQVEAFTRLRLITQTVRFTLHAFPGLITIPVWPVQSISAIKYDDTAGVEQTLAASKYTLVKGTKPRLIAPAFSTVWPSTREDWNAVRVDVIVGYGAAKDVPRDIIAAMKLLIGSAHEYREDFLAGISVAPLPGLSAARAKLMPHVLY